MMEVIWHARGGQGAFTAARALGAAAALSGGQHALAFPTFGPERRGAPMRAYTKVAASPIGDRSAPRQADVVTYLDETLFDEGWEAELKPGGIVLLNAPCAPNVAADPRIICVDADAISAEVLGRPIPNTAFLGAIAALTSAVTLEDVHAGIKAAMPERLQEANVRIADVAFEAVRNGEAARTQREPDASRATGARSATVHTTSVQARQNVTHTPRLREGFVPPEGFARSTCFTGGHLTSENAGWRSARPVLDEAACTLCLQCYLLCPDGAIFKVRDEEGEVERLAVDLAFCKGCGVCVKTCPVGCIRMVPEREEACA